MVLSKPHIVANMAKSVLLNGKPLVMKTSAGVPSRAKTSAKMLVTKCYIILLKLCL